MINKRGSHIGVVLSFLIFVTFLAFMYATLAPAIKIQEDKKVILNYLEIALEKNLSESLISISVVINNDNPSEKCLELEKFNETKLYNKTVTSSRLLVTDETGNIFPSSYSDGNVFINRSNTETDFFRIKISDEFDKTNSNVMNPCTTLQKDTGYKVGSINVNDYFFETKIEELNDSYYSEYDSLKDKFGVSIGNEFGFEFEYANGTTVMAGKGKETKASIYINEIPVQYVNTTGDVNLGTLKIKVW